MSNEPDGNLLLQTESIIGEEADTLKGWAPAIHLQSISSVWMAVFVYDAKGSFEPVQPDVPKNYATK